MADRVLAVGCHPDDIEFSAAGVLALLKQRGMEVHMAVLAGGEVGHPTMPPEQIRAVRLEEHRKSAQVIGATAHWAGLHDLEIQYDSAQRRAVTKLIRQVDPLIVLTHPPSDYLVDHEQTHLLVRNACYIASVPNYDCGEPTRPTQRFPYLYYWDAFRGRDILGRPLPMHMIVDVGSQVQAKRAMLACHASQTRWLSHHNKIQDLDAVLMQDARRLGAMVGCEYAEGLMQHLGHGHPTDNILVSMLGDLCHELPGRPAIG
jgi:LmbE family N-acetylglucosaminyl deacetylase